MLLQASPRDRRVIFEEAAGISRFKARKIEALRRLERVEQNLLRLSDIVDEVDNRLRSVRLQAGKARRYKEYTDRLQELRTQMALVDWRRLTERLAELEDELAALIAQRDGTRAEAEAAEARLLEAETKIAAIHEAMRQADAQAAGLPRADRRRRVDHRPPTGQEPRPGAGDRPASPAVGRHECPRRRAGPAVARDGGSDPPGGAPAAANRPDRRGEGTAADRSDGPARPRAIRRASSFAPRTSSRCGLRRRSAARSAGWRARPTPRKPLASGPDGGWPNWTRSWPRWPKSLMLCAGSTTSWPRNWRSATGKSRPRSAQLAEHSRQRELRQAELAELQRRETAVTERISVLEELEKRYEGLSPGVKDVLALARGASSGPFGQVRGLVADLLRVSVEAAPLVEVALGETAQHVVVGSGQRAAGLSADRALSVHRPGGIRLALGPRRGARAETAAWRGSRGSWDAPTASWKRNRSTSPWPGACWAGLGSWRDSRTPWHSRQLPARGRASSPWPGSCSRPTARLTVGPRHASIGLISRRSELRALRAQLAGLETEVQQAQTTILRLDQQIGQAQEHARRRGGRAPAGCRGARSARPQDHRGGRAGRPIEPPAGGAGARNGRPPRSSTIRPSMPWATPVKSRRGAKPPWRRWNPSWRP